MGTGGTRQREHAPSQRPPQSTRVAAPSSWVARDTWFPADDPDTDLSWPAGFDTSTDTAGPCCIEHCLEWFTPLLRSMTFRYHTKFSTWVEWDDVWQEASLGLVTAFNRYDPERGAFAAFARQCVYSAIMEFLRASDVLPVGVRRKLRALPEETRSQATRRQLSTAELAQLADTAQMTVPEVRLLLTTSRTRAVSWELVDEDVLTTQEWGEESAIRRVVWSSIEHLARSWPHRDRVVFFGTYLYGMPQKELAELAGVSQPRISQILTQRLGEVIHQLRCDLPE